MSLLAPLLALSLGASAAAPECHGDATLWLETLRADADRTAYTCLAHSDAAHPALLAAAQDDTVEDNVANRFTRALAIHLILRLDRALTPDEVRAMNASDRRLVRDAVAARRGRRTPSPQHAKVFEQFDWYQPQDRYNNGLLTELDRANIALLDDPPPLPVVMAPATAADAVAQTQGGSEAPRGLCGCSGVGVASGAWLLGLLALVRRRR